MTRKAWQEAFGTTFCAVMFTVAGWAGYAINWHGFNTQFGHQTGAPVVWEINLGVAFAVAAVVFWRRILRTAS